MEQERLPLDYRTPPNHEPKGPSTLGRFYGYFSSAYGTCFLAMFAVAIITRSQVQTGAFGVFGFPIISLIYAFYRLGSD